MFSFPSCMRLLYYANILFLLLTFLFTGLWVMHALKKPPSFTPPASNSAAFTLKNPFARAENEYQEISKGALTLKTYTPAIRLPDLTQTFIYGGRVSRPDHTNLESFHLILRGTESTKTLTLGEKVYLEYQRNSSIPYAFAPDNRPTSLWIEALRALNSGEQEELIISVNALDALGNPIPAGQNLKEFPILIQKPHEKKIWSIDGTVVDNSLLVRQRARWIGPDLFLKMHGGEEYAMASERERIDFSLHDVIAAYVKEGDYLIWRDQRWILATLGPETLPYPLLYIKKMDERNLLGECWNVEGTSKVPITLIKANHNEHLPDINLSFRFIGAKTWTQFMVEIDKQRMLISSKDWFFWRDGKWQRLSTTRQIDDFVDLKMMGPLCIFDQLVKEKGRSILKGHLFNSIRTQVIPIELTALAEEPLGPPQKPVEVAQQTQMNSHKTNNTKVLPKPLPRPTGARKP